MHVDLQEAVGDTWVLYDIGMLMAMLVCLLAYAVYVQTMVDFQPQNTYEVYDSLGGAQARALLLKKVDPTSWNGEYETIIVSRQPVLAGQMCSPLTSLLH